LLGDLKKKNKYLLNKNFNSYNVRKINYWEKFMKKCFIFFFVFGFFLNTVESASNIEIFVDYRVVPVKQVSCALGIYGRLQGSDQDILITDHRISIENSKAAIGSQGIILPLLAPEALEKQLSLSGFSTITRSSKSYKVLQSGFITKIISGASMVLTDDKKILSGYIELPFSDELRILYAPSAISITSSFPRPEGIVRRHTDPLF
jgi:hypothetical protein